MPLALPLVLGVLAAALALLGELVFFSFSLPATQAGVLVLGGSFRTLLVLAIIEESVKLGLLSRGSALAALARRPFGAALLFGFLFGLGFAAIEAILLSKFSGLLHLGVLGIFGVHAVTSMLLAGAIRKEAPSLAHKSVMVAGALVIATLLHALYNLLISHFS